MDATREPEEVSQLPPTWQFAFEKPPFPCFSPYAVEFQALVPSSIELHLLCHVTLLYCQVDPNPKPKAKSKARKSLLALPMLPLMWQPLAHSNQCYSSKSLPFKQVSSRMVWALDWSLQPIQSHWPPPSYVYKHQTNPFGCSPSYSRLCRINTWLQSP